MNSGDRLARLAARSLDLIPVLRECLLRELRHNHGNLIVLRASELAWHALPLSIFIEEKDWFSAASRFGWLLRFLEQKKVVRRWRKGVYLLTEKGKEWLLNCRYPQCGTCSYKRKCPAVC